MVGELKVFGTNGSQALTKKICSCLSSETQRVAVGNVKKKHFADGEIFVQVLDEVRDSDVFIIASTQAPAENIFEACFLANAIRNASAKRITMVIPYLGYNRQERKDRPRVPFSAQCVINMLSTDIHRVLLFDLHAESTAAAFGPAMIDHLYASAVLVPFIQKKMAGKDFVIASPDTGGAKRADTYAKLLGLNDFVTFYKRRLEANLVDETAVQIIGEVSGRHVVFVDDIIDTGGTLRAAATAAKKDGARSVTACVAHGLLSDNAMEKFIDSAVDSVIITDSTCIDFSRERGRKKLKVVSCDRLMASAIWSIHTSQSVSSLIL